MDVSEDWVRALTIEIAENKNIKANDLKENGIIPFMLHGHQVEAVHYKWEEAVRIMERLGINDVIKYPSTKMLEDIYRMPDRPFPSTTWDDLEIEGAKGALALLDFSVLRGGTLNYSGIRLEEDNRSVTRDLVMSGDVLPPRMIVILVNIVTRREWRRWPNEYLANEILYSLALVNDDSVELPKKQDSSRVTLRIKHQHSKLTPPYSRCYKPTPDRQMRSMTRDNMNALISSLEFHSTAKRADKYKSDLLVNGVSEAYHVLCSRNRKNRDFLFISAFLNYAKHLSYSASISIFEVFSEKVNVEDSIVRSRYDTSAGLSGALQFLHVMQKLVYRQAQYLRKDPGLLDTFAETIALDEPMVKAGTTGVFTMKETTAPTSDDEATLVDHIDQICMGS